MNPNIDEMLAYVRLFYRRLYDAKLDFETNGGTSLEIPTELDIGNIRYMAHSIIDFCDYADAAHIYEK